MHRTFLIIPLLMLCACGDDDSAETSAPMMPDVAVTVPTGSVSAPDAMPVMQPMTPAAPSMSEMSQGESMNDSDQSPMGTVLDIPNGPAGGDNSSRDCRDVGVDCQPGFECRETQSSDWVCVMADGADSTVAMPMDESGEISEPSPLEDGRQCGIIDRPRPIQSGVAYVAAFTVPIVQWFRLDGMVPTLGGELNLVAPVQDMGMDEDQGILITLHGIEKTAVLYGVDRPTSTGIPLSTGPQEITRIQYTHIPTGMAIDRIRGRLYTLTLPPLPDDGGAVTEMELTNHDISQARTAVSQGQSITVPSSSTAVIDPQRGLLFLYANLLDEIRVYDVTGPVPAIIEEMTLDLTTTFPETNNTGFSLRELRVDEDAGRLYAARAQGANSQAVAFEYLPAKESSGECVDISPFDVIRDTIDVATDPTMRTNLLNGFVVEPLRGGDGAVFLADAWNGTQSTAMLTTLNEGLAYQPGCAEFMADQDMESFGCFLQKHREGTPMTNGYVLTDGALCVDSDQRVVVATSYDPNDDVGRGHLHFYEFNETLSLNRWLPMDGSNLGFPGLPVVAICH